VHYADTVNTVTTSSAFTTVTAVATTQKILSFVKSGSDSILTLQLTLTGDLLLTSTDDVTIIIDMWTLPSALWTVPPACSTVSASSYNSLWSIFSFGCAASNSGLKSSITLTATDMFNSKSTPGDWLVGEVFEIPITFTGFDI
jgi:hypothetical protein